MAIIYKCNFCGHQEPSILKGEMPSDMWILQVVVLKQLASGEICMERHFCSDECFRQYKPEFPHAHFLQQLGNCIADK